MGCQCSTAKALGGAGSGTAGANAADPLTVIKDTPEGPKQEYQFADLLGKGSFGNVYRAVHKKSREVVAIKVMDRAKIKATSIHREWNVLEHTGHHPYVVDYKGTYKTKENVSFVLELMSGGELFDRLIRRGAYLEGDARLPFKRVAEGLAYLHKRGIVHRDLKPENILLKDDSEFPVLKIADFGLSQLIGPNERLLKICGTWAYAAPEMSDPSRPGYDCRFDCFSFGVILYVVLSGSHPFDAQGNAPVHEIKARARAAQFDFEGDEWLHISDRAKDLIKRLIVKDPEQRLDSTAMLAHPWFSEIVDPVYELVPVVAGDESKAVPIVKQSPANDRHNEPVAVQLAGSVYSSALPASNAADVRAATTNAADQPRLLVAPAPPNQDVPASQYTSNQSTVFVRTMSPEGSNGLMVQSPPVPQGSQMQSGRPPQQHVHLSDPAAMSSISIPASAGRMMGLSPGMTIQLVAGDDGSLRMVPAAGMQSQAMPLPSEHEPYHGHIPTEDVSMHSPVYPHVAQSRSYRNVGHSDVVTNPYRAAQIVQPETQHMPPQYIYAQRPPDMTGQIRMTGYNVVPMDGYAMYTLGNHGVYAHGPAIPGAILSQSYHESNGSPAPYIASNPLELDERHRPTDVTTLPKGKGPEVEAGEFGHALHSSDVTATDSTKSRSTRHISAGVMASTIPPSGPSGSIVAASHVPSNSNVYLYPVVDAAGHVVGHVPIPKSSPQTLTEQHVMSGNFAPRAAQPFDDSVSAPIGVSRTAVRPSAGLQSGHEANPASFRDGVGCALSTDASSAQAASFRTDYTGAVRTEGEPSVQGQGSEVRTNTLDAGGNYGYSSLYRPPSAVSTHSSFSSIGSQRFANSIASGTRHRPRSSLRAQARVDRESTSDESKGESGPQHAGAASGGRKYAEPKLHPPRSHSGSVIAPPTGSNLIAISPSSSKRLVVARSSGAYTVQSDALAYRAPGTEPFSPPLRESAHGETGGTGAKHSSTAAPVQHPQIAEVLAVERTTNRRTSAATTGGTSTRGNDSADSGSLSVK